MLQLNIPRCVSAFSNLDFSSCSLLPCGGEHGVLRRRGAALPTHRPPLLRPQRRLGRAAALGAEFLQPDRSFHRRSPPACPHTRTTLSHTHTHTPRSVTHCVWQWHSCQNLLTFWKLVRVSVCGLFLLCFHFEVSIFFFF